MIWESIPPITVPRTLWVPLPKSPSELRGLGASQHRQLVRARCWKPAPRLGSNQEEEEGFRLSHSHQAGKVAKKKGLGFRVWGLGFRV